MAVLLCILVGVGFLLTRYRDRLNSAFGTGPKAIKKSVDVVPGVKLAVVEIDGMTVVCGLNKSGITALQVVGPTDRDRV
jgi:hypothetical protein